MNYYKGTDINKFLVIYQLQIAELNWYSVKFILKYLDDSKTMKTSQL